MLGEVIQQHIHPGGADLVQQVLGTPEHLVFHVWRLHQLWEHHKEDLGLIKVPLIMACVAQLQQPGIKVRLLPPSHLGLVLEEEEHQQDVPESRWHAGKGLPRAIAREGVGVPPLLLSPLNPLVRLCGPRDPLFLWLPPHVLVQRRVVEEEGDGPGWVNVVQKDPWQHLHCVDGERALGANFEDLGVDLAEVQPLLTLPQLQQLGDKAPEA